MACKDCSNALVAEIDRDLDRAERVQGHQATAIVIIGCSLAIVVLTLVRKGVVSWNDLISG